MKFYMGLALTILMSANFTFAYDIKDYYTSGKALVNYKEAEAYCAEDDYWIPDLEILKTVILLGELQDLNRWFWSSTVPEGGICEEGPCHMQMHTKDLERRIGLDDESSAHALCVQIN